MKATTRPQPRKTVLASTRIPKKVVSGQSRAVPPSRRKIASLGKIDSKLRLAKLPHLIAHSQPARPLPQGLDLQPLQAPHARQRDVDLSEGEPFAQIHHRSVQRHALRFVDGQGPASHERDLRAHEQGVRLLEAALGHATVGPDDDVVRVVVEFHDGDGRLAVLSHEFQNARLAQGDHLGGLVASESFCVNLRARQVSFVEGMEVDYHALRAVYEPVVDV